MSADSSNLMLQVYDFFKHLYPASSPQSFLAFERLGFPINPAEFQINGAACPPLAIEWLSGLGNKALTFQNDTVMHSSLTIDGLLGLMLNASMPKSADDMTALGAAKLGAASKFDITVQSLSGIPNDVFRPIVASPVNWFEPEQAANWNLYRLGQLASPTSAPPSPTPNPPSRLETQPLTWSVIGTPHVQPTDKAPTALPPLVLQVAAPLPRSSVSVTLTPARMAMMARPALAVAMAPLQQRTTLSARTDQIHSNPRMSTLHTLQEIAAVSVNATARPVSSSDIFITFEYCVVSLEWPWIEEAFLLLRNWFVPGYAQSAISNGSGLLDTGPLPALPTGFILIRKLQIQANWAQSDLDAIQGAAGFGPFSLAGRTYNTQSGLLTCDGMQIIGWFCSALPQLPPCQDPHLAIAPGTVVSTTPPDTTVAPSVI